MTIPASVSATNTEQTPLNHYRTPPYKLAGLALVVISAIVLTLAWYKFRGYFDTNAQLFVLAGRSGLAMDPGSKVTLNGVPIGRLEAAEAVTGDNQQPGARLVLNVDPHYLNLLPRNVDVKLRATTVFGNKYVAFTSPPNPSPRRLRDGDVVDAAEVTTELNTLFETITAISEQIDPIKLNQTLTAAAQALDGLGDKFGHALVNSNDILADLNQKMPLIHHDIQAIADLVDTYATASPDLWGGLDHAVTTARTLNNQRVSLDQALMASVGFGATGADTLERGGPYFVRGSQDLLPTSAVLDKYSPELGCLIREFAKAPPLANKAVGGNGYSMVSATKFVGAANEYIYPENLPRINASGGPMGRPGCWTVTKDIWPVPYMVADTGASIAPYNHFGLGSPFATEYIWGRQVGEKTINP